jgi:hypothetical protein
VDVLAAVNLDEAGLGALRLAHVRDRHHVHVDARGVLRLRVVRRELARVEDRVDGGSARPPVRRITWLPGVAATWKNRSLPRASLVVR